MHEERINDPREEIKNVKARLIAMERWQKILEMQKQGLIRKGKVRGQSLAAFESFLKSLESRDTP